MPEIISVRFHGGAKEYFFDPKGWQIQEGQFVVVDTAQGMEYVQCTQGNHVVPPEKIPQPLRGVVRPATENDDKIAAYNRKREKEAFGICEKKIAAHRLEMKLVRVECSFEGNKIIFFFTAEGRVDFRELVRDLAGVFRTRIELRQIGVRDEAKMLGGLGVCGQELCCNRFLSEFMPVSIKMAKTQNLPLNPSKISGNCGRLLCCLKYEQDAYEDAIKRMPKVESFVDTPDGLGNVSGVDALREQVQVRLDSSPDSPKRFRQCEIRVLRSGRGSREGIEIPKDRPPRYAPENQARPRNKNAVPVPAVPAGEQDEQFRRKNNPNRKKNRPQQFDRTEPADICAKVEKIPVRSGLNATKSKKAAADRAYKPRHKPRRKP